MYKIEQLEQSAQLVQTLIQKAWESEEFKAQLIDNPDKILSKLLGKEIEPSGSKKLIVEDQTDSSVIYLNIPARIKSDDIYLDEAQLELISGGNIPFSHFICLGITFHTIFQTGRDLGNYLGEQFNNIIT